MKQRSHSDGMLLLPDPTIKAEEQEKARQWKRDFISRQLDDMEDAFSSVPNDDEESFNQAVYDVLVDISDSLKAIVAALTGGK